MGAILGSEKFLGRSLVGEGNYRTYSFVSCVMFSFSCVLRGTNDTMQRFKTSIARAGIQRQVRGDCGPTERVKKGSKVIKSIITFNNGEESVRSGHVMPTLWQIAFSNDALFERTSYTTVWSFIAKVLTLREIIANNAWPTLGIIIDKDGNTASQ